MANNFDLKKYLAEGKLYEENQSPKFKKDDEVRFNDPKYKQWSGRILSIEEPTPEGEPTYKVHMNSGRLAKYSFGSLGTFKESELSPFRVTSKEESGGIDEVYGGGGEVVIFANGEIIKGTESVKKIPIKDLPQYNTEYYSYDFPIKLNNNPAIQWLKSKLQFKEVDGVIRFTESTFQKFIKKQGIPHHFGLPESYRERYIKTYLDKNK